VGVKNFVHINCLHTHQKRNCTFFDLPTLRFFDSHPWKKKPAGSKYSFRERKLSNEPRTGILLFLFGFQHSAVSLGQRGATDSRLARPLRRTLTGSWCAWCGTLFNTLEKLRGTLDFGHDFRQVLRELLEEHGVSRRSWGGSRRGTGRGRR